jgi:hypothetical protein
MVAFSMDTSPEEDRIQIQVWTIRLAGGELWPLTPPSDAIIVWEWR